MTLYRLLCSDFQIPVWISIFRFSASFLIYLLTLNRWFTAGDLSLPFMSSSSSSSIFNALENANSIVNFDAQILKHFSAICQMCALFPYSCSMYLVLLPLSLFVMLGHPLTHDLLLFALDWCVGNTLVLLIYFECPLLLYTVVSLVMCRIKQFKLYIQHWLALLVVPFIFLV